MAGSFRYHGAMAASLMPVQLGQRWLAIPAEPVQEVLGERSWVAIPSAPPDLPGVLAWRGRAVAILDLGRVSGAGDPLGEGQPRRRTMVVQQGGLTLAVPVDGVREVHTISDEGVHPPVATRIRFAAAEVEIDGLPMPVLDLPALVAAVSAGRGG
jgi:chemotaxis signal transduction protein